MITDWATVDDWVTTVDGRTGRVVEIRGSLVVGDPSRIVHLQLGTDGPFEWHAEENLRPADPAEVDRRTGQTRRGRGRGLLYRPIA